MMHFRRGFVRTLVALQLLLLASILATATTSPTRRHLKDLDEVIDEASDVIETVADVAEEVLEAAGDKIERVARGKIAKVQELLQEGAGVRSRILERHRELADAFFDSGDFFDAIVPEVKKEKGSEAVIPAAEEARDFDEEEEEEEEVFLTRSLFPNPGPSSSEIEDGKNDGSDEAGEDLEDDFEKEEVNVAQEAVTDVPEPQEDADGITAAPSSMSIEIRSDPDQTNSEPQTTEAVDLLRSDETGSVGRATTSEPSLPPESSSTDQVNVATAASTPSSFPSTSMATATETTQSPSTLTPSGATNEGPTSASPTTTGATTTPTTPVTTSTTLTTSFTSTTTPTTTTTSPTTTTSTATTTPTTTTTSPITTTMTTTTTTPTTTSTTTTTTTQTTTTTSTTTTATSRTTTTTTTTTTIPTTTTTPTTTTIRTKPEDLTIDEEEEVARINEMTSEESDDDDVIENEIRDDVVCHPKDVTCHSAAAAAAAAEKEKHEKEGNYQYRHQHGFKARSDRDVECQESDDVTSDVTDSQICLKKKKKSKVEKVDRVMEISVDPEILLDDETEEEKVDEIGQPKDDEKVKSRSIFSLFQSFWSWF